jgi:hypothetical protein
VPPVTQPPQPKPTTIVSAAEATQHQKVAVLVGRAPLHRSPRLNLPRFHSLAPSPEVLVGLQRSVPRPAPRC